MSTQKAKIVTTTIRHETRRIIYNKISSVLKLTVHCAGLSKLNIPWHKDWSSATNPTEVHQHFNTHTPDNLTWDTITNKADIEKNYLLTYNWEAFGAASESICGHGTIYSTITYCSLLSPAADEELQGSSKPPKWHTGDPLIQEIFASFAIPDTATDRCDIPTEISIEQKQKGFKTWKEMTTTSPLGRQFGHYKPSSMIQSFFNAYINFSTEPSTKES
jgi:hypothetical protein